MLLRLKTLIQSLRAKLAGLFHRLPSDATLDPRPAEPPMRPTFAPVSRHLRAVLLTLTVVAAAVGAVVVIVKHPPMQQLPVGHLALRTSQLSGETSVWRSGPVWAPPGLYAFTRVSLQDKTWHATAMASASGPAPAQSVEGLSIGLDLSVRYAVDPARLTAAQIGALPTDLDKAIVEPAVQATVYKIIARHTVREIFSSQRAEIEEEFETQIGAKLAADGLLLRSIHIGNIDLPEDYRRGMEVLLTEGLSAEKMRYTLELREKQVKETELTASADKARREIAAEAAAREQVIAAKAQEEAMKHVLPFKQRQIEQRKLEADANRVTRVQQAEAEAQARLIEAKGEAEARQKLADAEAYRLVRVGKANADQMALEGALITKHPLLIQKTMADRLSDKVQVIIASPSQGGFIGNNLLGAASTRVASRAADDQPEEQ
jgi:regulator of protease activity HflC (stomatin/prohibitin superfamily)